MIQVENLTKHYGPKVAISDVTFDVGTGEVVGFLGPNGAGKTTTMRILAGYMPATSGAAHVAGHDVFADSVEARRHTGYLPENVPLYPEMVVEDYLGFMADIRGVARAQRRQRIDRAMELARVGHQRRTIIGKLSKGYRQRVGLAQAVLHNPRVLILDEPTVGLDPRQIIDTRGVIRDLGGDHTVILSTHILPEVEMTCSRVVIINEGRIVAEDTTENLTRRLRGSERVELEVAAPAEEAAAALRGVPNVLAVAADESARAGRVARLHVDCTVGQDVRAELARAVVGRGWDLLQLRNVGMSLEEVFLKLTRSEAADAASGADGRDDDDLELEVENHDEIGVAADEDAEVVVESAIEPTEKVEETPRRGRARPRGRRSR